MLTDAVDVNGRKDVYGPNNKVQGLIWAVQEFKDEIDPEPKVEG